MEKITGRTDDMMIVRGVNVFPTQVEEQLLRVDGLTPHYLCVLTRPARLDEMTVRVEAHDAAIGPETRTALGRKAAHLIKHNIGVTVDVEVVDPHVLERSLGKAKRIEDRRESSRGARLCGRVGPVMWAARPDFVGGSASPFRRAAVYRGHAPGSGGGAPWCSTDVNVDRGRASRSGTRRPRRSRTGWSG
ncbi:MAG: hypothetical protein ACRDO2_14580 [Nocardioidaceae bacterium]